MKVPYVSALVRRDSMNETAVTVLAHELVVLRSVHGEEAVNVIPTDRTLGGRVEREIENPRMEWDRLVNRYGANPDTGVEFVSIAFGTPPQMAAALADLAGVEVDYVEETGLGDAAGVEVERELSPEEIERILENERREQGFTPVTDESEAEKQSEAIEALKAQNELLTKQVEALIAASAPEEASEPPPEAKPVSKMSNDELRAELASQAVEFDDGANNNQLRALVASVRDQAAAAAAA